eukprot:1732387-Rhodomonas_salina.2
MFYSQYQEPSVEGPGSSSGSHSRDATLVVNYSIQPVTSASPTSRPPLGLKSSYGAPSVLSVKSARSQQLLVGAPALLELRPVSPGSSSSPSPSRLFSHAAEPSSAEVLWTLGPNGAQSAVSVPQCCEVGEKVLQRERRRRREKGGIRERAEGARGESGGSQRDIQEVRERERAGALGVRSGGGGVGELVGGGDVGVEDVRERAETS